jgi:ABC-type phosphate/phosphonate transport system substrate-binding protein
MQAVSKGTVDAATADRRRAEGAVRRAMTVLSTLCLLARAAAADGEPPPAIEVFRIGVSNACFGALNRNDASAALKAWAVTVARERKLQVDVRVELFETLGDLRRGMTQGSIHAVSLTSEEFFQVGEHPEYVCIAAKGNVSTEQYLLLVHRDGGVEDLPALRDRRLVRHVSATTSPALPWLETLFADQNLGRADEFLGEVSTLESPSKSILRVFFRQSDACLVTASAFDLACELNPQLRRQLKVLASSPPLIPTVFFFRNDYLSPQRREFESAILDLHTTVAGQQVLTVFQSTRMEKHPVAYLDATRQLFESHARLRGPAIPE